METATSRTHVSAGSGSGGELRIFCDQRSSAIATPTKAQAFMNAAYDALTTLLFESGAADARYSLSSGGMWIVSPSTHRLGDLSLAFAEPTVRNGNDLETASLAVSSATLSSSEIMAEMRRFVSQKNQRTQPKAGEPKYVFDSKATQSRSEINARVNQHVNSTPDHVMRMQRIVGAPRSVTFTKHRFHSTKTFANLCGDDVRELQRRVTFFLENQEWYRSKGIPYQLGIMLSGPCGTGKSSAIRAIANATHRSIVNVNLSSIATASQLKRLFLNDALQVYETDEQAEQPTPMLLPVADRIFVLDEIDSLGGAMVLDRANGPSSAAVMPDELSLGELLTMFDGGVEVPGRIIVMLSNYPERLDKALVRPGRIDIHVRFGLSSRKSLAELYAMFYDVQLSDELIARLPDGTISPAEASDVFISERSKKESSPERVVELLCAITTAP